MSSFTSDFITFFKELEKNNSKEWFDANRKRYEATAKKPFEQFIGELIERVHQDDQSVDITPRDAILRINRDIRFSKDKSPYQTYMAAIISPGGKKDKSIPGLYIQFNAEEIRIYGGAHFLDKEQLHRVRTAIAADPDGFSRLINAPVFKNKFGEILGEKHKRVPAEFASVAETQPLIANKQFYFFAKFETRKYLLDENLLETVMEYYYACKDVNHFLRNAMANEA